MTSEASEEVVDVVVVGSGVAGLTAALVASLAGLRVTILEKTGLVGGATAFSSGGAFLPGCHLLPAEADPAAVRAYLDECTEGRMDSIVVDAWLSDGPKALALLEAETEVRFQPSPGCDYRMHVAGASLLPRTVTPVPFDGRVLGDTLKLLRPPLPTTTILGGMQVDHRDIQRLTQAFRSPGAALYAARLLFRHLLGRLRHGRSPRLVGGNALVGRLLKSVLDRGIDLRLDARAIELVSADRRVTGVTYLQAGETRTLIARHGVVLASGGFSANAEMRAERVAHAGVHQSLSPTGSQGEGIAMAVRAGARMGGHNLSDYCLTPVSHITTPRGDRRVIPHFGLDRGKPGVIAVDATGRRFVNEGLNYSDFVLAMHAVGAVPAFLICDHRFLRRYGLGMVLPAPFPYRPFIRQGYLVQAATIEALATKLGIDPAGLELSVRRNNAHAAAGYDAEFGKGDDPYSRALGDARNRPHPCLGPIARPPYYAIRLYPGDTSTTSGLVVDGRARVLDRDDQPIAGLYACGPDMANPTLGANPSGGCNIGPALTFGFIAARDMARHRTETAAN